MIFRYLTVAFLAFYLIEESGPALAQLKDNKIRSDARLSPRPGDMLYYGTEGSSATTGAAPSQPTFNLEQRRTANDDELVRLRKWYDELKMRKRDLLHSDVQGNREYVVDLALYNEALAKAMTERNALDALAK